MINVSSAQIVLETDLTASTSALPSGVIFENALTSGSTVTPSWETDRRLKTRPSTSSGQNGFLIFSDWTRDPSQYSKIWYQVFGWEAERTGTNGAYNYLVGRNNFGFTPRSDQLASGGRYLLNTSVDPIISGFRHANLSGSEVTVDANWNHLGAIQRPIDFGLMFTHVWANTWRFSATIGNVEIPIRHGGIKMDTASTPWFQHRTAEANGLQSWLTGARLALWRR